MALSLRQLQDSLDAPGLVRDGPPTMAVWAKDEDGYSRHLRDCAWRATLINRQSLLEDGQSTFHTALRMFVA